VEEQLAALRLYNLNRNCPTNAGMLVLAYDPLDLFPGAKVQFVQYAGPQLADDVLAEKTFTGNLITLLAELDSFLRGRLKTHLARRATINLEAAMRMSASLFAG
jgi:ATP-dependent DNA helicase RecG